MSVILFIDMLGSRKRWQTGGVNEAMKTFFRFKTMVKRAVRSAPEGAVIDGGIETDAAMLVCPSTAEAIHIARRVFLSAFEGQMNPNKPRLWYRGCVVSHEEDTRLRVGDPLGAGLKEVTAYRYSASALEAVSVEKSGYKGMRVLVQSNLIDKGLQDQLGIPLGSRTLIPFRKLNYSYYPQRVRGEFTDYLWMACETEDDWFKLNLQMTSRLRYAARDEEEFLQAAATQLVFSECAAIRQSVIGRARRAEADPANAQ
jgi:hypothetical protein